ncbi:Kynurenine 3-monooxygenase [Blattella germanica]|nr:Kynurenine 3-monooxygenase [Blattella germanica]
MKQADQEKRFKVAIIGGGLCIYSVSRRYLNEVLLTATEKLSNVHLHFNHKLVNANLQEGCMTFQMTGTNETKLQKADLIIGADGAFSTVRRHMMKQSMFDYSQTYIEHGYLELCMPPTEDGEFAMEPNYLHIWPRGTFMMIALPNQDRTWTVTLFMPFHEFQALNSPPKILEFFSKHFPDSIPLIGKHRLVTDFIATKPSPLLSIKGFEDCRLLDKLMAKHNYNLQVVLEEFSNLRNEDAEAICDLAMYNYLEMRDLVNRKSFLLRKKVDNILFWLLPNVWVPLYLSVAFTNMGYKKCMDNKHWQDRVIFRYM